MAQIAATKVTRNFPKGRDAPRRETVAVIKGRNQMVIKVGDLDEETIAALASAKMDPKYDYLNALMD
jgi:hypothetical protein